MADSPGPLRLGRKSFYNLPPIRKFLANRGEDDSRRRTG